MQIFLHHVADKSHSGGKSDYITKEFQDYGNSFNPNQSLGIYKSEILECLIIIQ